MKTYQNRLSNLGETCWLVKSQNEDLLVEQEKGECLISKTWCAGIYIQETREGQVQNGSTNRKASVQMTTRRR